MIAFGPVPSRRLGRSLGINNIPPKRCTYSCVYCQLGRTVQMQVQRQEFYPPEEVSREVQEKVRQAQEAGEPVEYLTFVPDGEPTLDLNLARAVELLRPLGVKIAVITNGSLIRQEGVRAALALADWVSLKVDAVQEEVWRRVDRPHGSLRPEEILEGMVAFAAEYRGVLVTETMLVAGVNDGPEAVAEVAEFLGRLRPTVAYLAVPTRPPAEAWVRPPEAEVLNRAYQVLSKAVGRVEYLVGYEGNAFASTGDVEDDLLRITAVHPMREEAVAELLKQAGADWDVVRRPVDRGLLVETEYEGHRFFLRPPRPTG